MLCLTGVAAAQSLPDAAQRLLDDLGSTESIQKRNNGRKFKCVYGGHKTVAISPLGDATLFSGDFNNCREPGSTRDGYYEVIVRDWEIVAQSQKRSVNGQLQDAAKHGDIQLARKLIRQRAAVNYAEEAELEVGGDVENWTPLMSAAMTGNARMVRLLLDSGAWVNVMNSRAVTPLWLATASGSLDAVTMLVKKGAYLNNSNDEDITPLMLAAMNGFPEIARFLIASGADIHAVHREGDSALMFAIARGHSGIAKMLVEAGGKVNIRNKHGVTPLVIAVAENNEDLVRYLLGRNADTAVSVDGKSLLDLALAKGNRNIIDLIKNNAGTVSSAAKKHSE